MRWHREIVRRHWTYPPPENIAPNALDAEVVALVLRLARENSRWGYLRIVGELRKLGVVVSGTSVRNVLDDTVSNRLRVERTDLHAVASRPGVRHAGV